MIGDLIRFVLIAFAVCIMTLVMCKPASAEETLLKTVYVTGYSWYDNTPPGSGAIAFPKDDGYLTKHNTAAGTGTYDNPITVAVGWHSDGRLGSAEFLIDRPGRRFYSPWLDKYFMVEDLCGDQDPPESGPCWRDYPSNATVWVDFWVDGRAHDPSVSEACMDRITDVYDGQGIIYRPGRGYPVREGSLTQACLTYIE